jgi:hypothetical protein
MIIFKNQNFVPDDSTLTQRLVSRQLKSYHPQVAAQSTEAKNALAA